jgi:hypothetical protein
LRCNGAADEAADARDDDKEEEDVREEDGGDEGRDDDEDDDGEEDVRDEVVEIEEDESDVKGTDASAKSKLSSMSPTMSGDRKRGGDRSMLSFWSSLERWRFNGGGSGSGDEMEPEWASEAAGAIVLQS